MIHGALPIRQHGRRQQQRTGLPPVVVVRMVEISPFARFSDWETLGKSWGKQLNKRLIKMHPRRVSLRRDALERESFVTIRTAV
jgi:hypothetical protein